MIGATLVPIVGTALGLSAVVLVGAVAYLLAILAFRALLRPLVGSPSDGARPVVARAEP